MKRQYKLHMYVLVIFCFISFKSFASNTNYVKAKVLEEIAKVEINDAESGLLYSVEYKAIVKSGTNKGKMVYLQNLIYDNDIYNTPVKVNDNIVLYEDNTGSETEYYIYNQNKLPQLISLLVFFVILVVGVARMNGLKAVIALGITIILVFKALVPLILAEYSPLLLAIGFCIVSTIITILFITQVKEKIIISILGTSGGVITAGLLSYLYINLTNVTGFINMDVVNFSYLLGEINLRELVSAGIIIGSLGAVMDVSVSITSSLYEIKQINHDVNLNDLINSGMNIGKDIIGTMVNTLVFAYLGSSLFTILLFLIQKDDFPIIRVFNTEFIIVEVLRALCGSFGIIVVVPITALLGSLILIRKDQK